MSLHDARMPSLKDKLQAEAEEAEKVEATLEKEDEKVKKVLKKKSNKK